MSVMVAVVNEKIKKIFMVFIKRLEDMGMVAIHKLSP